MTQEIGWLIELKQSVSQSPTWYGENEEGVIGWTRDHMMAVRFARKDDAERVINCEGLNGAFACEHAWGGGRSGPRRDIMQNPRGDHRGLGEKLGKR